VVAWSAVEATRGAWSVRAPGSDKALAEGGRVGEYRAAWVYGLGRTADTVILDEKEGRAETFSVVKLDGSGTTPLQDQPLVQRLWFDPKSGQLIGYTAGADEMKVTLFDAKVQARVDAAYKAFPGYSVQLISASASFGRMIVQTRGKDDAGTFWLVDLSTGKATPLGASAPIPGADLAAVTTFDYKASDGLAMHGVLTLPNGGGKNLPVVVMPTGTGSLRARPEFDWWAQAFASRGYAVFQPNPRGVVGFGNAFHVAGQGELTRKSLSDVADGVQALAAAGVIDPNRLCTVGEDMGGFSALSVVAVQKFPARCVVGFATPSDLTKILIEVYWQDMVAKQRRSGPYTGAAPVHFDDASPNKYIQNIRSPVLLIHPKDDANVPVTVSRTFAEAMKKAGKTAEVVELDGADHFLWDSQTRIATLKASVAFVERNNPAK
jgi:dipeptidyl aminopeptidase/acylaminoacyl peptidase